MVAAIELKDSPALPKADATHTLILALQQAATVPRLDKTMMHLLIQAASHIAQFDRHRHVYERRRSTVHKVHANVLGEYCATPHHRRRDSELEVMFDTALILNAIERDEPIGYVVGGEVVGGDKPLKVCQILAPDIHIDACGQLVGNQEPSPRVTALKTGT